MVILGLSSLAIITFTLLTVGKYWIDIYQKYQEKSTLEAQLVTLKGEEEKLAVDAEKLEDPDYIARYAREKYYYSKDGEIIFRLPDE